MLSDEERKALEILKSFEPDDLVECAIYLQALEKITDLIDKQSKEIEELRNEVMEKELIIDGMKEDRRIAVEEIQEQYYVSKDKIKAKIEEVKEEKEHYLEINDEYNAQRCDCIIEEYDSLLEKE